MVDRRSLLATGALLAASTAVPLRAAPFGAPFATGTPRERIIIDNDLGGDPDGLFAFAHHLLSPSVAVRLAISSHLHAHEPWPVARPVTLTGKHIAEELMALLPLAAPPPVIAGCEDALGPGTPAPTPAARAIIAEAMRDDPTPLTYCAGAGLTDLATAIALEPRVAKRLKLVWIGGNEYPGLADPPPGPPEVEYNLSLDLRAAQMLFANPDLVIWQVPRSTYRLMLVSMTELAERLRPAGPLGTSLLAHLDRVRSAIATLPPAMRMPLAETYVLGDSPLVTLTALVGQFQPDPASSPSVIRRAPKIADDGTTREDPAGKPIRVFTGIDTRLTFDDMFAKFAAAARAKAQVDAKS